MKESTRLKKKLILETYRKDFPGVNFNDYNSVLTISNNGRLIMGIDEAIKFGKTEISKEYLPLGVGTFIHKSLIGIDDNNGWILIEPDGSNLPERGYLPMWKAIKNGDVEEFNSNGIIHHFKKGTVTHYKPITPELKPIY